MVRIFVPPENIYNAVDAVVADGYAAVEGTKSIAVPYCGRIIDALEPYEDVTAVMSYQNVPNSGYLYLVVDTQRYSPRGHQLLDLIEKLDRNDQGSS
ncbi:hypothetical protein [Pseudoxanthomonas sp. JBR18]|uniref:hypothetical protein n=1 Tax=Pseudoxanthomonas sp. JBR18 TaxID=2969308 RepID=UPI002304EBE9|nr:hypothetical protein [Pseudoxanthomonas sp. JBR18]WCE04915.1 hypothetical protein PJ250_02690 [Pseudoxanthomonas sp. JBR18]